MKFNTVVAMVSLLTIAACGGGGGGSSSKGTGGGGSIQEMVEASPGTYYTVLRPVNFHSNGFIPYGSATFSVNGDQIQVSTTMDDDQAVTHRQSLHIGTRCPTMADDRNGDGFVDYDEALAVVGSVLMPLDNDLSSQKSGEEVYPRGSSMTYNRSASLATVNADMWKADENPADHIRKLPSGKGIGFDQRVVLIHGTSANTSFPASLATYPGEASHISLPVVCGVLKKVD